MHVKHPSDNSFIKWHHQRWSILITRNFYYSPVHRHSLHVPCARVTRLTWNMSVLWLNILVVGSTANIWHKLIHLLLQRWWYAHAIATRPASGRRRRATAAASAALGSRAAMYIEQVCCKSNFHITVDQAQWHGSGKYMKCLNAEKSILIRVALQRRNRKWCYQPDLTCTKHHTVCVLVINQTTLFSQFEGELCNIAPMHRSSARGQRPCGASVGDSSS